jgi:hypothetical protein
MNKYRVVRDLQGGSFGMDRDYTADEWIEQAREWCEADDNTDLDNYLERMQKNRGDFPDKEVIDFIADIWQLEFEQVKEK